MAASRPIGPNPATRQRRPCSQSGVAAAPGSRANCKRTASSIAFSTTESGSVRTAVDAISRGTATTYGSRSTTYSAWKPSSPRIPRSRKSPVRHMSERFMAHGRQRPQPRRTVRTARSPGRTRFTASPTSTTSPTISWPMMSSSRPGGGSARPPAACSRSVPQIPTRRTRSTISSGADISGSGRSTSRTSRVPGTMARALTMRPLSCAIPSVSSPPATREPPRQRAAHGEAGAEPGHGVC